MKIKLFILITMCCNILSSCYNDDKIYDPKYGEGYYILTPEISDFPRINGANLFGVTPGNPFLYTIPVTGKRPMKIWAENLPEGLIFNPNNNQISGTINDITPKDYLIRFCAENSEGKDTKDFTIKVGNLITLTPPMGWSSWICTKKEVSQEKVESNISAFMEYGLREYGYTYINIDDAWQGKRGGKYNAIMPDSLKFPDMQGLCDYVHSLGLKIGIYSSPWVSSYAGYVGSSSDNKDGYWDRSYLWDKTMMKTEGRCSYFGKYRLDHIDAKQWADWGIDYMKYDWNPNDSLSIAIASKALRECGRDIPFAVSNDIPLDSVKYCPQYAQVFRTNGDLRARWSKDREHVNMWDNWNHHKKWLKEGFSGAPGCIPDPDFLMVGLQKYGSDDSLSVDELYHHVSSFVLWGAPLLLSCNLSTLNEFERSLITNVEMLDINQDNLAIPAKCVYVKDSIEVLVKDLADGEKAIGIFNFNDNATVATLDWKTLGLNGNKILRDVWRQKDIGTYKSKFIANIRSHGCVVVRTRAK